MANTMNDAIHGTKHAAKDVMGSAKKGAEHAASTARTTLMEGISTVAGVITILRGLHLNDALGWIGLERRRGPWAPLAAFGAGVAVGAGAGMLFAPMSGADTRRYLMQRFGMVTQGVERAAQNAERAVEQTVEGTREKVEDKIDDLAKRAEKKAHPGNHRPS
ncbi:MAG: YtxH domain-containing protein [Byssovorax sp.]